MSIKQRLYPKPHQEHGLVVHCGQARFVYNLGLSQRKALTRNYRQRGVKVTYATQCKELAQLRSDVEWLRKGSSEVQQSALRDLDRAFGNFFAGRTKYPVFKKRSSKQSFCIKTASIRRYNKRNAGVHIPKVGWVKFRISMKWWQLEKATSARISCVNGKWFVSFTTPPPDKKKAGEGIVGIDRGVKITAMTSDGDALTIPESVAESKRYNRLNKALSRKDKNSAGRKKILRKMDSCRFTIANRRKDWLEKTTTILARRYSWAVLEDLKTSSMTKRVPPKVAPTGEYLPNGQAAKTGLNRSISSASWRMVETRLSDKMNVVKCPAFYTSQRCFRCGHISAENRKSQAVFSCTQCGHTDNADHNAALNIRESGSSLINNHAPREDFALCLNDGEDPTGKILTSGIAGNPRP
ncbi:transposase [Corynebacterium sp. ACRPE]|uniref:RNA-guided endonuclease InsQ/TnpB family protein n=1 Tax=Corynebacterium sp. ACRPE TaxID=2918196 RepID=UPI001EF44C33|nr:transposase [Corynebacterium sp. ACRPE]